MCTQTRCTSVTEYPTKMLTYDIAERNQARYLNFLTDVKKRFIAIILKIIRTDCMTIQVAVHIQWSHIRFQKCLLFFYFIKIVSPWSCLLLMVLRWTLFTFIQVLEFTLIGRFEFSLRKKSICISQLEFNVERNPVSSVFNVLQFSLIANRGTNPTFVHSCISSDEIPRRHHYKVEFFEKELSTNQKCSILWYFSLVFSPIIQKLEMRIDVSMLQSKAEKIFKRGYLYSLTYFPYRISYFHTFLHL